MEGWGGLGPNDHDQPEIPGNTLMDVGGGRIITWAEVKRERAESQEQRARRLFDEMARNIGRETVNYLKRMYPEIFSERGRQSKSWEISCTNHIRNDINWRMRPLLMAMIAMHREWEEERAEDEPR